jgi:hypothetical protein
LVHENINGTYIEAGQLAMPAAIAANTFTPRLATVMLMTRPKGKSINSDGAFPWVP